MSAPKQRPEPTILPVRPGTVSAADRALLRRAGVVVIEHESPEELRLLRPSAEVDAGQMLSAAVRALAVKTGVRGQDQRDAFVNLLARALTSEPEEPRP